MRTAAYVYSGWHPIPERDASFHPGFTEWELVAGCRPRFPGHHQPKVPLLGPYDDRDPIELGRRLQLALAHGIDAFVFGVFWCRGKRVFEQGLDDGFLRYLDETEKAIRIGDHELAKRANREYYDRTDAVVVGMLRSIFDAMAKG